MLFCLALTAVRLRLARPDLMEHFGLIELTYLGLVVLMISIVGLLGHYGGKLVFHWKDKAS